MTLISLSVAGLLFAALAEPEYLLSPMRDGGSWAAGRMGAAVDTLTKSKGHEEEEAEELPAPPPKKPSVSTDATPTPTATPARPAQLAELTTVEGPPGFAAFWRSFRTAMLNNDVVTVASMTQFPFMLRNVVDDLPVIQVPRKKLPDVMERALERDMPRLVESGKMVGVRHQTQREFLKAHESLTILAKFGERWARVGDLQFRFKQGRWYWYLAILDP